MQKVYNTSSQQKDKMMDKKPVWTSKTMWVNGVALAISLAAGFGIDLGLDDEGQAALVGGIMSVVNIVLRMTTKTAITGK